MNKQIINTTPSSTPELQTRFDLKSLSLSETQLKTIAGARPCQQTCTPTKAPITKCCW